MSSDKSLVSGDGIERAILLVRGEKVMLDSDLAELYGVSTKALNQAVKRNEAVFQPTSCFGYPRARRRN